MAGNYPQSSEKGKAVVKQFETLKAVRSPLDREYRECYEYTKPSLGAGFDEGTRQHATYDRNRWSVGLSIDRRSC